MAQGIPFDVPVRANSLARDVLRLRPRGGLRQRTSQPMAPKSSSIPSYSFGEMQPCSSYGWRRSSRSKADRLDARGGTTCRRRIKRLPGQEAVGRWPRSILADRRSCADAARPRDDERQASGGLWKAAHTGCFRSATRPTPHSSPLPTGVPAARDVAGVADMVRVHTNHIAPTGEGASNDSRTRLYVQAKMARPPRAGGGHRGSAGASPSQKPGSPNLGGRGSPSQDEPRRQYRGRVRRRCAQLAVDIAEQ